MLCITHNEELHTQLFCQTIIPELYFPCSVEKGGYMKNMEVLKCEPPACIAE